MRVLYGILEYLKLNNCKGMLELSIIYSYRSDKCDNKAITFIDQNI